MEIIVTRDLEPNSLSAKEYMEKVFAGIVLVQKTTSYSLGDNKEKIIASCRSLVISGSEDKKLVNRVEQAISSSPDLSLESINSTGLYQQMYIDMDDLGNEIYGVNRRFVDAEYDQQLKIDDSVLVEIDYKLLREELGLQRKYPTFAKGVLSLLGRVDDVKHKLLRVELPKQKDIHPDSIKKEIDHINKSFVKMRNVVMAYSKKDVKAKRKFLKLLRRTIGKLLETIELNSGLINNNHNNAKALMGNLKEIIYPTYEAISEKLEISPNLPTVDLEFLQTSGANYVTPGWLNYPVNLINTCIDSLWNTVTYYVTQQAIQAVICYATQHAIQAVAGYPSYFSRNGSTLFASYEPCADLAPNASLSLTLKK